LRLNKSCVSTDATLEIDVPLDLFKAERRLLKQIAALESQIRQQATSPNP
jgi:hypothetical protein